MLEIFMNYATLWIVVGLIAAVLIFKQLSYISPEAARKYLQEGALVVDVRSVEEYRGEHLPMAMNIPLGDLQDSLPGRVKDKNQVLLLHCLSGTRSGIAKRQLKGMGYQNVFNLGSYGRAKSIVSGMRGN
ncbi:MAG: rhodanese-like domain-containing protein [Verrucomicrobiota bacterium]